MERRVKYQREIRHCRCTWPARSKGIIAVSESYTLTPGYTIVAILGNTYVNKTHEHTKSIVNTSIHTYNYKYRLQ